MWGILYNCLFLQTLYTYHSFEGKIDYIHYLNADLEEEKKEEKKLKHYR